MSNEFHRLNSSLVCLDSHFYAFVGDKVDTEWDCLGGWSPTSHMHRIAKAEAYPDAD